LERFFFAPAIFSPAESLFFLFLHIVLTEFRIVALLENFKHGVFGLLHPCLQLSMQRGEGSLVFGVVNEVVQAVGIVSHVVKILGHAVFVSAVFTNLGLTCTLFTVNIYVLRYVDS
jgi:hypothetical protein